MNVFQHKSDIFLIDDINGVIFDMNMNLSEDFSDISVATGTVVKISVGTGVARWPPFKSF